MKKIVFSLILCISFISWKSSDIVKVSYYHDKYHGRKSANGERFDQTKHTCAANNFDFGTHLCITNKENGKSVEVIVTDRLAKKYKNRIDLSKNAFRKIASLNKGIINAEVEEL